jgi:hypothetical protein
MSLPRPIRPYHFQADLIWWDGPFKYCKANVLLVHGLAGSSMVSVLARFARTVFFLNAVKICDCGVL